MAGKHSDDADSSRAASAGPASARADGTSSGTRPTEDGATLAAMAVPTLPGLLTTDELAKIEVKKREAEPERTPLARWWARFNHLYRTRVRTTTVILIVLFVAGLGLYAFTTSYYGEGPQPPGNPRPVETTERHTEPSTTVSEHPSSSIVPTEELSPWTSPDETTTTSPPSSTGLLDRVPGFGGDGPTESSLESKSSEGLPSR